MKLSRPARISLRVVALSYLTVLLLVPRITLPAIRWGLTYGVVLTVARALGEFGAVIMVSSGFPGVSQTLTLLVHARYIDDHNAFGAYCAATLLMGIAVVVLLLMTLLDRKRSTTS